MAGDLDAKARAIARATVDEFQNRGLGLDVNEVRSVLETVDSNASEFTCVGCGSPVDPSARRCSRCGSKAARISSGAADAPYRCERCNFPIGDPKSVSVCPGCGHDRAVRVHSNPAYFTCANCLDPVDPRVRSCGCGSTRAYRTEDR